MVQMLTFLFCGSNSDVALGKGDMCDGNNSIPHYRRRSIHHKYALGKMLGHRGTFGEARSATQRDTGLEVAVKIVRKHKVFEKMLRNEEYIMRQVQNEHVAGLYEVYEDRKCVYFVLEKCSDGDLIDVIQRSGGRLSEHDAAAMIRDVAQALAHVHTRGYAHCDVKPSNILFKNKSAKLIDFGVSQSVGAGAKLHQEVGSPSFMAPEVINGCYDQACDMWSLGVVLFVALYGFNPFNPQALPCLHSQRRICETVLHGFEAVSKPGYGAFFSSSIPVSEKARNLIKILLVYDSSTRPTCGDVLAHPWLQEMQQECCYDRP